MRRILSIVIMSMLTVAVMAVGKNSYLRSDSSVISKLLMEAKARQRADDLQLFFARKFIGRPYVAHTLEVYDDERLIVNTRELDCTTLVETVIALTLCARNGLYSFQDYMDMLTRLRYRQGNMNGYPSRLHYFSDWIYDKSMMGLVVEIQGPVPPFTAVQSLKINYMSKHSNLYRALKNNPVYVSEIAAQEKVLTGKQYRYIPKSAVRNTQLMRNTVRNGDIIAITCNKDGLDIAHLGFAVWHKDGLHLLNASMIHRKVVEETMSLYSYLKSHPSHTGIRIIRIK